MIRKIIKWGLACLVVVFVAQAVGTSMVAKEADVKRIAEENNFDADRTAAFRRCDKDMLGKTLSAGGVTYFPVPDEICICHSREMVAVFRSGAYSSHESVVDYIVDENDRKSLAKEDLKYPYDSGSEFDRLAQSLIGCATEHAAERQRLARERLSEYEDRQHDRRQR